MYDLLVIKFILAFFCGDIALQLLPYHLSHFTSVIFIVLFIISLVVYGLCWLNIIKPYQIKLGIGLFCAFLGGFLNTAFYTQLNNNLNLPSALIGKNTLITGYVSSLPENKDGHASFDFTTKTIGSTEQEIKIRLSWYGRARPLILASDQWQLLVRLKPPHGMKNPGGFDYEKYLMQHKISAVGYVVINNDAKIVNHVLNAQPDAPMRLTNLPPSFKYLILRWRQNIEIKIKAYLTAQPLVGMINALVVGDQSGISKEQWQIFSDTGTSYLMAIAGLHIGLAAATVFLLVQYLWRCSTRLMLWMPARQMASLGGLAASIFYSVLSGFSVPTQRALIMLGIFVGASLLRRQTNSWYALFAALLVVIILDPNAVLATGFWLSFVAMILIFYMTAGRIQLHPSWWCRYSRMQWAITLGLAPFTLIFFAQASAITMIANIIALPGVCSLVVPLSLLGSVMLSISPYLGKLILLAAGKILEVIWIWLQWLCALLPQFNWQHYVFHWWLAGLAIIGVLLILAPRGFCGKVMGGVWIAPLVFYVAPMPHTGEIWFNVLDVGQGLATVIQTQHHVLLYDTGPKFIDSDVGESVVLPFLRASGINHIDAMVISHGDSDHSGGITSIVNSMPTKKIVTSALEMVAAKYPANLIQACYAGQSWQWDGVNFYMLYPPSGMVDDKNKTSCVLRIDNGKQSILLTGDIEAAQEKYLLVNNDDNLASTILVVPHHGSMSSSTMEFIHAVMARYAIFSVGYKNRFHFPAPEVVKHYQQQGAKVLLTSDSGAITFKLSAEADDAIVSKLYREQ